MKCTPFSWQKLLQLHEFSKKAALRVNGCFHDRTLFSLNQTSPLKQPSILPSMTSKNFNESISCCLQISHFPHLSADVNEFLCAVYILEQLPSHAHVPSEIHVVLMLI